jgi:hypothetical protein
MFPVLSHPREKYQKTKDQTTAQSLPNCSNYPIINYLNKVTLPPPFSFSLSLSSSAYLVKTKLSYTLEDVFTLKDLE